MASKVRLFVTHDLGEGKAVPLTQPQAHYLFGVMRLGAGGVISLFNGRDGEWDCEVVEAGKKRGLLACMAQTRPQQMPPDLWLMFAPVKKARTDFIVEKAVEMGAAKIMPVLTEFTNAERVRIDRLQAHCVEAAEQCGGTYVPQFAAPQKLTQVLTGWDKGRMIMHCDEATVGHHQTPGLGQFARKEGDAAPGPWAILIGPEGGFSDAERGRLDREFAGTVVTARLGPRILRADTAAVAALTLWQSTLGDWV